MAVDEILAKDLPQVILAMREMSEKVSEIDHHVGGLLKRITAKEFITKKGISFLELKFHLLLSYVIDLVYYLLIKTDGQPWEGNPAVERLVEVRTVLEKLRPIDQKMKYQIDKLIKTATTGLIDSANDPLRFKPNPDNMATKLEDDEPGSSDEEEPKKAPVYVPPKVSAVHYDEDFEKGNRKQRDEEKARKRALKSSLLQDLRDEYSEGPQEIREETVSWSRKQKEREDEEERTRYEEENLLRLPAKKMKKVTGHDQSGLGELTSFADLSALTTGVDEQSGEYSRTSSRSLTGWKIRSKGKRNVGGAKKKKGLLKKRRR